MILGSIPGRINIKCKGLKEEACLVCSRNGKDISVAGTERMLGIVVGNEVREVMGTRL